MQVPNNVSNHLTTGLLKYFHTTGRYASGINLFEKLRTKNIEVSSLLAKVLIMGNEEVQAVRVLHEAVKESPMDYVMLDTQADFLMKKALNPNSASAKENRLKMALGCAERGTVAAPSEFGTWARLAEAYVAIEDWENALTTLNSCPMFTYQDKDAPVMPEPKDVYLPTLPETRLDEIDSEPESKFGEQVHPSLIGLRAAQYRGTFKQAYSILTEMTAKIGWDQLLKIRSQVFVMEEEYRGEKQHNDENAKRNPSTDVLRGSPNPVSNGTEEHDEQETNGEGSTTAATTVTEINGSAEANMGEVDRSLEKPEHTIDKEEVKGGNEEVRHVRLSIILVLITCRTTRQKSSLLASTTSVFVSAGLIRFSWCYMKIFASTLFGVLKWHNTVLNPCNTRNLPKNGRSLDL